MGQLNSTQSKSKTKHARKSLPNSALHKPKKRKVKTTVPKTDPDEESRPYTATVPTSANQSAVRSPVLRAISYLINEWFQRRYGRSTAGSPSTEAGIGNSKISATNGKT